MNVRWATDGLAFLRFCAIALILPLAALQPTPAYPQGYAGLGTEARGFALPSRDTRLEFPRDHGPHPDFRIEWWYLTANLTGPDGTEYGVQWTLFRSAITPGASNGAAWQSSQVWMGHAGLTTPDRHFVAERLARGGTGQAGVSIQPFEAWIDDWQMRETEAGLDPYDALSLRATGPDFAYALDLNAEGPLVLQGENGYSVKSAGEQASHYYSQPFYNITGTLSLPGGDIPVSGQGWLDREWSSQPLSETQDGWDWISLHFDSGDKLMGFRLRDRAGTPFTSATWIAANGSATPYSDGHLSLEPLSETSVNGAAIPTAWRVTLPEHGVSARIEAVNPQSWMSTTFPYWEGPVRVSGSHSGRGYLEMTGYGD